MLIVFKSTVRLILFNMGASLKLEEELNIL